MADKWRKLQKEWLTKTVPQLICMEGSIWYLCMEFYGVQQFEMRKYHMKSKKKYEWTYPDGSGAHSMCQNKNEIYIVDGTKQQIVVFEPRNKTFKTKIKIPEIGHSATCISLHGEIHIFGGSKNSKKHLIYLIKQNKIKILNDSAATQPGITHVYVTQYKNKIIRVGGYKSGTYYSEVVISADAIKPNAERDVKWKQMPLWKCSTGVIRSGYITHNQYIIRFGGTTKAGKTDSIYILNVLNRYKGWMELKHLKCPEKDDYIAGLDQNNDVHLISVTASSADYFHHSIALSAILTKDITAELNVEDQKDDIKEENDPKPTQSTQLEQLLKEKQETEAKLAHLQKEKDEKALKEREKEKEMVALREENNNLQSLLEESLQTQSQSIDELRNENERLKTEMDRVQLRNEDDKKLLQERGKEIESLQNDKKTQLQTIDELRNEIKRLKTENSEMNEECKEIQLELIEVKNKLRKLTIDPRNYLQWSPSEVVDWIVSIQDGKYAVYEKDLRSSFAAEGVDGTALSEISKPDLKDWGIKNFMDRSNLYKEIQNLLAQENEINANLYVEGDTAYVL